MSSLEACLPSIQERQHPEPREYHVAQTGTDSNDGTASAPFRSISEAARIARSGDVVTVHEGVYRERVSPARGGDSDDSRITYQAAPEEEVVIKGSEAISGWQRLQGDVWSVTIDNGFFGDFNPYSDRIDGHWFEDNDRAHHTGAVYLNGDWLDEAASHEDVLDTEGDHPLWFGEVDETSTTLVVQFPGVDPNHERVEINVRQTVFYPQEMGLNFITVRGFSMCHAATPWAPPTQRQMGLVGPNWSKGWIIEDNTISHSMCVGISLGLGDTFKEVVGTGIGTLELYHHLLDQDMWTKEKIGYHVVRNNRISHCEQAGIAGNCGAVFSLIEENEVSDIHVRMRFSGMEQGGIKLHAAIDTVVRRNCVYRTGHKARGIWLDWMAQGAQILDNLVYETRAPALYLEVNHGPILVANNILIGDVALCNRSRGTAYAHNLFAGRCVLGNTTRVTPYMAPHETTIVGEHENWNGDDQFYNNIFAAPTGTDAAMLESEVVPAGRPKRKAARYDDPEMPSRMEGNLYLNGALPHELDHDASVVDVRTPIELSDEEDGIHLRSSFEPAWIEGQKRDPVNTARLGQTSVAAMAFEHADGSPVNVDRDYLGNARDDSAVVPGPFASFAPSTPCVWTRKRVR
jgi:alpha-N-arabinofuranosidase